MSSRIKFYWIDHNLQLASDFAFFTTSTIRFSRGCGPDPERSQLRIEDLGERVFLSEADAVIGTLAVLRKHVRNHLDYIAKTEQQIAQLMLLRQDILNRKEEDDELP